MPLDMVGYRPAVLSDQPQPLMMWVEVANLVVDCRYQRAITTSGRRAVQRIADGFDWRKYEPILIAPAEGGTFAVVDGQHRAHAAGVCGIKTIPAMCVPMTLAEQAQGFAAINRDRIRISLIQIYRAELVVGAGWALACKAAVEDAGCSLATSNQSAASKKPGHVFAIGLIRRMVAAGEGAAVTAGLSAIAASSQADEYEAYGGGILGIWLPAVAKNNRFVRMDLSEAFDGIDIELEKDEAARRARQLGGSAKYIAIDAVAAHLNFIMRAAA